MSTSPLNLTGDFGRFLQADARRQDSDTLATLQPILKRGADRPKADLLMELDEQLAAIEFKPLGDLICDQLPGVVMRGYGSSDSKVYAVLIMGMLNQASIDFYTVFEDGSSLTTTSAAWVQDISHRKIFRKPFQPKADIKTMLKRHIKDVALKSQTSGLPKPALPDLLSLAQAIDEYLVRQRG